MLIVVTSFASIGSTAIRELRAMSAQAKLSEQQDATKFLPGDFAKIVNEVDDQMTALADIKETNGKPVHHFVDIQAGSPRRRASA